MTSQPAESDELERAWDERPEIIRAYIEARPHYEQLCDEVAYILGKRMKDNAIEYSTISSRAKTLKSFAEKLTRKKYENPLKNVTDLAGVRLVFLYHSDRPTIEQIIEAEFDVIEKVDKVNEQEPDRFGYGALHYLAHLGRKSSGARYDDLKGLICEIQVRTVLQDAWAIIDHHLSYKHESEVPKVLKRKLNSLAGLFETADDQFNSIRIEREDYKKAVKSNLDSKDKFPDQDINLDTFVEFLKWKFPKKEIAHDANHISVILSRVDGYGYTKLSELEELLARTVEARAALNKENKLRFAVAEVAAAIAFVNTKYRDSGNWSSRMRPLFKKYEHLVA